MNNNQAVLTIIAEILGVEPSDITEDAEFILDLNATPEDIKNIKLSLESTLDISLEEFEQQENLTVGEVQEMVEDSLL